MQFMILYIAALLQITFSGVAMKLVYELVIFSTRGVNKSAADFTFSKRKHLLKERRHQNMDVCFPSSFRGKGFILE